MKISKVTLLVCAAIAVTGISAYSAKGQMATVYREKVENVIEAEKNTATLNEFNLILGEAGEKEENSIIIKNGYNNEDVRLSIADDTMIIDASSKLPINLSEIEESSQLIAYANKAMTFSIPPITNGQTIITNISEDSVAPIYFIASEITKNEDGSIVVKDGNKNVEVTINSETSITPYRTRNIIGLESIKIGDRLIVWKNIDKNGVQTLELPEKITAESCIVNQG